MSTKFNLHMCDKLKLDLDNSYRKYKDKCDRKNSLADFVRLIIKNTYRYLNSKNVILKNTFDKISESNTLFSKSMQYSQERNFINKMCKYFLLLDYYNKYDFENKTEDFTFRSTKDDDNYFEEILRDFKFVSVPEYLTSLLCYFLASDIDIKLSILNINIYELICSAIKNKTVIKLTTNKSTKYILPYKLNKKGYFGTQLIGVNRHTKKIVTIYLNDIIGVEKFEQDYFEFTSNEIQLMDTIYEYKNVFEVFKIKVSVERKFMLSTIFETCIIIEQNNDIYTIKTTLYNLLHNLNHKYKYRDFEIIEPENIEDKIKKYDSIALEIF